MIMENDSIAPFLRYLPTDALYVFRPSRSRKLLISPRPNTPKLSLSLELQSLDGPTIAKKGSNNVITFIIYREPDDGHEEPCTIYWHGGIVAFSSQGFLLLRHMADGQLEKIDGLAKTWWDNYLSERRFFKEEQDFYELKPGETIRRSDGIEDSWLVALIPGERYELLWPGGEIPWWGWGTKEENVGKLRDPPARAILLGSPRLSFDVVEYPPPPVYKTPRPQWPAVPAYVMTVLLY